MHPLAQALADAFIPAFASADREITWLAAEEERSLWLSPNTCLVGRCDARGLTGDGKPFFGEWKSISNYRARYMDEEKVKWRTDPQALTYGVLVPETKLFTVRWAIKPNMKAKAPQPPSTDFEWFTYTQAEVDHWRAQLLGIAQEIRQWRALAPPWRTNFGNCYHYGIAYACPFIGVCGRQAWGESMGRPRIPHLAIEPQIKLDNTTPDLVVLDASRVGDYLECPESYRRKWEGEGYQDTSEALIIGTDFHAAIAAHIKSMIAKEIVNA